MNFEQHRFRSPSKQGISLLENSLRCGVIHCPDGKKVSPFITAQYALVYLVNGCGQYKDDQGKVWKLKPGDLFQRFPSRPHSNRFYRNSVWFYLAVPSQVYDLLALTNSPFCQKPVHSPGLRKDLQEAFEMLMVRSDKEQDLFLLLRDYQDVIIRVILACKETREEHSLQSRMEKAALLLQRMPDKPIAEIALLVGMNYHSFRRHFSQWADVSPGQYRIHKRIEQARNLLLDSGQSISSVADALGYNDLYSFSHQFKQVCGLSPRDFIHSASGEPKFKKI